MEITNPLTKTFLTINSQVSDWLMFVPFNSSGGVLSLEQKTALTEKAISICLIRTQEMVRYLRAF